MPPTSRRGYSVAMGATDVGRFWPSTRIAGSSAVTRLIKIANVVKKSLFDTCWKVLVDRVTEPHLDTCLDLISDAHRRRVIDELRHETAVETTVDSLVERLHEDGLAVDDGQQDRAVLWAQLTHNHLPKLAEHGVVDYDRDDKTVRYQPAKRIETVLDALPQEAAQPNT